MAVAPAAIGSAASAPVAPDERVPLVAVPLGCQPPTLPYVVFEGTLIDSDDRTGRFLIREIRAGDPAPYAIEGQIDIRYGNEIQYLDVDQDYVVSAGEEPSLGLLSSRIAAESPLFGGDDIIGLAEPDIDCPELVDPIRTLYPDGATIETSVLQPLSDDRRGLATAVLVPVAVTVGVLFFVALLAVGIRGLTDAVRQRRP